MSRELTSSDLEDSGVIPMIYSLVYPETRAVRSELYDGQPGILDLHEKAFEGRGVEDHAIFLTKFRTWLAQLAFIDPVNFSHQYVGNGSSEPIRAVTAKHIIDTLLQGREAHFHIFDGEYQGYEAYVDGFNTSNSDRVRLSKYDRRRFQDMGRDLGPGSRIMLSQPSGIDGNYWEGFDEFMGWLAKNHPDVPVDVDLAYAGATTCEETISLDHPNIASIFFSLSKVFGVYRDRTGGVFSREEIPGLFGNKWFNNAFSLEMGRQLIASHEPCELPKRYANVQGRVVEKIARILGEEVFPSDVLLMAHQPEASTNTRILDKFQRAHGMRYCLTPAIDRIIKH